MLPFPRDPLWDHIRREKTRPKSQDQLNRMWWFFKTFSITEGLIMECVTYISDELIINLFKNINIS